MKTIKEVRINVKITRSDRKQYREYCNKIGTGISKRIRELIQLDMNDKLCQEK